MTSSLFRPQVIDARRDAWLGEAQIAQPLSVRLVAVICFVMIMLAIGYLSFGSYARRVHAQGVMTPDVGLITVASPSRGLISSSGAKEGDHVVRGQFLYKIDLDAVSANGPTQERVIAELVRQKESIDRQRTLRAATADEEKKALHVQADNLEAQAVQLKEQIGLQQDLVPSLKARLDILVLAVSNGIARSADLQAQNSLYMQAATQLAQFRQTSLQLSGQLSDVRSKLSTFDSRLAQDLADMDRMSAQLEQQRAESEALRGIEVRAPESGTLTSIRAQAGQAVAAGAPLLTILPSEGRLQANLFVDSSAIGFVETKATVMLRYAAFPFQRFGLHRGIVTEVTRAPVEVTGNSDASSAGGETQARTGVYRLIVRPESDVISANGEERPLQAGMLVEADIALEQRPLYRWLFDPLYHAKQSFDLVTGQN